MDGSLKALKILGLSPEVHVPDQLSSGRLWGGERSRTCKAVSAFCYSFTLRVSGGCRCFHDRFRLVFSTGRTGSAGCKAQA